ncbi:MAG: hypothetical protein DBY22_02940 [Clostridiales bacterium]|nr:MAG: hypothetical protein DBY22_02940 [Clostridiales bacterium]
MIIRDGYVTNSSSTNFMIISKEKLTRDYLIEKLGFKKGSSINSSTVSLANDIVSATEYGVRWFEVEQIDYDTILKIFGKESAEKYKKLSKKGYYTYFGHTNSDDDSLTSFMTMDSFVIDERDFYMDGKNCIW